MILFVTSKYPRKIAASLNNSRVQSMLCDCVQLLSNNLHSRGFKGPVKLRDSKHRLNKWLAKIDFNYWWVFLVYSVLINEYALRKGEVHESAKYWATFYNLAPGKYPDIDFLFAQVKFPKIATPIPVFKYWRQVLSAKWDKSKKQPKWTNRQPPDWYQSKRRDMRK